MNIPPPMRADRRGWPWEAPAAAPAAEAAPGGQPWPRITLVTPSYNHAAFIEETIRSVLLQGYPDLEYLVIDGGSTDGSVDIIRQYAPWLSHWESEPDRGQSHALNKGFARATGEIFGWLCSDDVLEPGALFAIARCRAENPDAVAWVGRCREIEKDGRERRLRVPRLPARAEQMGDWSGAAHFYQPACLFAAEAFRRTGNLDEQLVYSMDVDLWIRLSELGRFASTDAVIAAARLYPEATTFRNPEAREAELIFVNARRGRRAVVERRVRDLIVRGGPADSPWSRLEVQLQRHRYTSVVAAFARRTWQGLRGRLGG